MGLEKGQEQVGSENSGGYIKAHFNNRKDAELTLLII